MRGSGNLKQCGRVALSQEGCISKGKYLGEKSPWPGKTAREKKTFAKSCRAGESRARNYVIRQEKRKATSRKTRKGAPLPIPRGRKGKSRNIQSARGVLPCGWAKGTVNIK